MIVSDLQAIWRRAFSGIVLLPLALLGCSNPYSVGINPFATKDSAERSFSKQQIQKAYDQSLSRDYLAILGSQLGRSMILNSYWRFLGLLDSKPTPETLRGNFIELGYFSAPTLTTLKNYCIPDSPYIGAVIVRQQNLEIAKPPCGSDSGVIRVPLGHSMRGFTVSESNRFATAIPLDVLAKISKQDRPIHWNDINPKWPKRPIRWVFNSQTDFKEDLTILGITLPSRYLLAASYNRSFLNISSHPDNLLFSPTTPSLKARLQGAKFRIVPIQVRQNKAAVEPSSDNIDLYPAELVRTIFLYVSSRHPNRCIIYDFGDFMLSHNATLMNENNLIPLRTEEREQALREIRRHRDVPLEDNSNPLCLGYQKSLHERSAHSLGTQP